MIPRAVEQYIDTAAAAGYQSWIGVQQGMTTDNLEVRGQWWLPGRADRKIPGILTFSPEDGAELSLFGSLRGMFEEGERTEKEGTVRLSITQAALERSGSYPRLHGDGGGTAYTLQDCLRVRS